jgi:hypothetical protein
MMQKWLFLHELLHNRNQTHKSTIIVTHGTIQMIAASHASRIERIFHSFRLNRCQFESAILTNDSDEIDDIETCLQLSWSQFCSHAATSGTNKQQYVNTVQQSSSTTHNSSRKCADPIDASQRQSRLLKHITKA